MSRRFWIICITGLLLASAALYSLYGSYSFQPLRSEHSQPARHVAERQVAVTPEGKLFHDPRCTYMHGKPVMMTESEAIRQGYTPCIRCMREALKR
jgi:hypothetical protein